MNYNFISFLTKNIYFLEVNIEKCFNNNYGIYFKNCLNKLCCCIAKLSLLELDRGKKGLVSQSSARFYDD